MTTAAASPVAALVPPVKPAAKPVIWAVDASVWRDHPLGRGEFMAAVFSGSREGIGEMAGQDSWATPFKFALPDPRLGSDADFASTTGEPLPRWPAGAISPAPGVCFVFDDERHPHLAALVSRGGVEHEQFVVLTRPPSPPGPEARIDANLRSLAAKAGAGPVAILGYGDQGSRIAARLRAVAPAMAHRAVVIDASPERRRAAQEDGFAAADPRTLPDEPGAAVYTPLARYPDLAAALRVLEQRGAVVLENPRASRPTLIGRGPHRLDVAAARILDLSGGRLTSRLHDLPIEAAIVREDVRRLGGIEVPHLHGVERVELGEPGRSLDLSLPSRFDRLSPATFVRAERACIAMCGTSASSVAPLGCLAAREFCARFWPEAVGRVFPAPSWPDLGRTPLERRLQRSISSRTVGASLQSWAQQVLLGVVAAHYAPEGAPIIEIGCATGGSTALMGCATAPESAGARGPEIYTIDPDPAMEPINRFVAQQEGYADRYHPVVATSDDAAASLRHLSGRCGVVFIDGDHSEAGALRDFCNYAGHVRPGGALLFHDVSARDLGVMTIITHHAIPDPRFRLVCLMDTMAVFERVA